MRGLASAMSPACLLALALSAYARQRLERKPSRKPFRKASAKPSPKTMANQEQEQEQQKEQQEQDTLALTVCTVSDADLERVYLAYPRHVGKAKALEAIRMAVASLGTGENWPRLVPAEALSLLHEKVTRYAQSPSGTAGKFTPHAATWFNQARYLDDESEWEHGSNSGHYAQGGNGALGPEHRLKPGSLSAGESKRQLERQLQTVDLLTALGMARRQALEPIELQLYSKALEEFPIAAISLVLTRLAKTERLEFEPRIPELGNLIAMVRSEAQRANQIGDCGLCGNSRMRIVDTDGVRCATRCQCWLDLGRRASR